MVLIFGAGIAGLSAAHYLVQRGYNVTVVESLNVPGGLARSARYLHDKQMPSEYSWRGFGPWYHNTYSLMKEIPMGKDSNIYDSELSNPINFIMTPDTNKTFNTDAQNFDNKFGITYLDMLKLGLLWLKTCAASDARSHHEYAQIKADTLIRETLSKKGAQTIRSLFGPWVGSDHTRVSAHHVSSFFRRNLWPGPPAPYSHPKSTPPFSQGGGSGWLILKSPSNESWFEPWVDYLSHKGVKFMFGTKLEKLEWDPLQKKILHAVINNRIIKDDYYVLAINPYITKDILDKTSSMLEDPQLALFKPLTADSPHKQISFRIAFSEDIKLPGKETAVILVDSEFNITFFSQDQLWHDTVFLGKGVKSLWSGTATVDSVNGKLYGLPMKYLTKNEFLNEIKHQIYRSKSLNSLISLANNGRCIESFSILRIEVWDSWIFPAEGTPIEAREEVRDNYPKWVNNSTNLAFQPTTQTTINNLLLAGAHTRTFADLYSMEAAVESGKRVADVLSNMNSVIPQHTPVVLKSLKCVDSFLYSLGLPNIINVIFVLLIVLFFTVFC